MNTPKGTPTLDKKAIRVMIIDQLKTNHPNFTSRSRTEKRKIANEACKTVERMIRRGQIDTPELTQAERIGLGEIPEGVMTIEETKQALQNHQRSVLPLQFPTQKRRLKDPMLRKMDEVLQDSFLDQLLATPGMTPAMRTWMPSMLLRIELLRTYRYPEVSIRKYCDLLSELDRREERTFCHLSLRKRECPDHSLLSRFRSSLSTEMRINLMVFILAFFLSDDIVGEGTLYALDSTDVAIPINNQPLVKLEIPGHGHIRLYADLDCDCGKRRNKRDKSSMFVGYRIHTLCVVDAQREYAFPVLSLAVAANHHDSQVLEPMLALAKAIGLDVRVLSLDEAYSNADKQKDLIEQEDMMAVTTPQSKAAVPPDVDSKTGQVFCHGGCEHSMTWCGYDGEAGGHCYTCGAEPGSCPFEWGCPKERTIPLDTGLFGPIPFASPMSRAVQNIRKVAERPFNLFKHMDGVEPCRMKSQPTFAAQMVFSQMIGLFKVMAKLRAQPKDSSDRPVQGEMKLAS